MWVKSEDVLTSKKWRTGGEEKEKEEEKKK